MQGVSWARHIEKWAARSVETSTARIGFQGTLVCFGVWKYVSKGSCFLITRVEKRIKWLSDHVVIRAGQMIRSTRKPS